MKLKIDYVPTEELKAYVNNAKIHTSEQIEQIKKSIEQFGFNDPIAVWKDNEIIEGHGRLIAALEMGIEKLPIIRLDNLTDEQRRAYILVHNQLTINTGFDIEVLNDELESITEFSMEDFGLVPSVSDLEDLAEETGDVEEELKKVICPRCGGTGWIGIFTHIDGGRCYLCNGSGEHYHKWKEMTPEYTRLLGEKRAEKNNKKTFERLGLDAEGNAYVVLGNTYKIKDELKEAGAKFVAFGWHFDKEVEGFDTVKINVKDVADVNTYGEIGTVYEPLVKKIVRAEEAKNAVGKYIGEPKERITFDATLKHQVEFETFYGTQTIYKFIDSEGNVLVWKTGTAKALETDRQYKVTGTVKEHSTYRDEKQTVLTRCKIQ